MHIQQLVAFKPHLVKFIKCTQVVSSAIVRVAQSVIRVRAARSSRLRRSLPLSYVSAVSTAVNGLELFLTAMALLRLAILTGRWLKRLVQRLMVATPSAPGRCRLHEGGRVASSLRRRRQYRFSRSGSHQSCAHRFVVIRQEIKLFLVLFLLIIQLYIV